MAPDWFWITFNRKLGWPWHGVRNTRRFFRRGASRIIAQYFSDLIADLSEDGNALAHEPEIVRETLAGISPRFSPDEASGEFCKRQVKLAMEAYDKLPEDPLIGGFYWLAGFVPRKHGG